MDTESWDHAGTKTVSTENTLTGSSLSDEEQTQATGGDKAGIDCFLRHWTNKGTIMEGKVCSAIWDGLICWPPTEASQTVFTNCSEILGRSSILANASYSVSAFRSCSNDGTWAGEGYTNYSQCIQQWKEAVRMRNQNIMTLEPSTLVGVCVPYVLVIGSIVSSACLTFAIGIYLSLRSLYLERLRILVQMMIALLAKTAFPKIFFYPELDWLYKVMISIHYYILLVSTFLMLAYGHYLDRKLVKARKSGTAFKDFGKQYAAFSWGVPILVVSVWATLMELKVSSKFWNNHSKSNTFVLIAAPLLVALLANVVYLSRILRVLTNGNHLIQSPPLLKLMRKAKKELLTLCPILGIHNLLLFYNPGGQTQDYFMLFHAFFQSAQGTIVSFLCCFISTDVRKALKKR